MMSQPSPEKQKVIDFYEQYGWSREAEGTYKDTAKFEDLRPVTEEYRYKCHLRVNRYLHKGGRFLLDVASGAIPHPEYLTYSEGYAYRVCADIAHNALSEARKNLGEKGLYVQCDITHLPFRSESMDGCVSLHTIYHVPADEQGDAFLELYRVLKPGMSGVVVYARGEHQGWLALLRLPYLMVKVFKKVLAKVRISRPQTGIGAEGTRGLYFHSHSNRWLEVHLKPFIDYQIAVWRFFDPLLLKMYIHPFLFGKKILDIIYDLEEKWPEFMGKAGAHPMFILRKSLPDAGQKRQPQVK